MSRLRSYLTAIFRRADPDDPISPSSMQDLSPCEQDLTTAFKARNMFKLVEALHQQSDVNPSDLLKALQRPELGIRVQRSSKLSTLYASLIEAPDLAALGAKTVEFIFALAEEFTAEELVELLSSGAPNLALAVLDLACQLDSEDADSLGDILSLQILRDHFSLETLCTTLPDSVSRIAEVWLLTYAAWLFRLRVAMRYGNDFANLTLAQAVSRLAKVEQGHLGSLQWTRWLPDGVECLDRAFEFWEGSAQDKYSPEIALAIALLVADPSSPYYRHQDSIPPTLDTDLAKLLFEVRAQVTPLLEAKI